jgi:diguanylate cyclase (GGDEF)-like protein/PAS domain S-box-containing protein
MPMHLVVTLESAGPVRPLDGSASSATVPSPRGRVRARLRGLVRAALPAGRVLPGEQWERHHRFVLRVLAVVSVLVMLYAALRGYGLLHVAGHGLPLVLLLAVGHAARFGRGPRAMAAALGLMTASALAVHVSHGATEAHFAFFALLPVTALYASRTPFLLAVGYVAVHHFVLGSLAPAAVFENHESALGMAALHAAFVLAESAACLVAWRLFEDRRELVERLVLERTAELRERRDELARWAAIIESTGDAVVTTSLSGLIVTWNPGAERLYGYALEEVIGEHLAVVVAAERQHELHADLAALAHAPSLHVERVQLRKDGSPFESLLTLSRIYGADGTAIGVAGIARDISERKRSETDALAAARQLQAQAEQLTHMALHDPLTGLANRTLMTDRLERALAARGGRGLGVLLLDLDDFKSVNDVRGHGAGDAVLIEVSRRLQSCIRQEDTVARLGGDEFVILAAEVEDGDDSVAVAERVLRAVAEPIEVGGEPFLVTASIGIAVADGDDRRGPGELLRDADIVMYVAKAAGKGHFKVFEAGMRDEVVAHSGLVRDLREAVANGELRLLYQPQVDLASGRVIGAEALVRWEHPQRGLVMPDAFIPVAESIGMIGAIDDWVLQQACAQLRAWDDAGLRSLTVAVNVSARRLIAGDLADTVARVTLSAGVDPTRLEIEITETAAVAHEAEAVEAVRSVRALGVRVAIDDFGTGYSALSRLHAFPLDRLKIDRSFVAPLSERGARGSIVGAMIALGNSLGLMVIAEGVETEEHVRALRSLGCGAGQGYLFSRPVPAATVERIARAGLPIVPPQHAADSGSQRSAVLAAR